MSESKSIEIQRSHMLILEIIALVLMILLYTQGLVRTIVDAAIVIILTSITGYVALYLLGLRELEN